MKLTNQTTPNTLLSLAGHGTPRPCFVDLVVGLLELAVELLSYYLQSTAFSVISLLSVNQPQQPLAQKLMVDGWRDLQFNDESLQPAELSISITVLDLERRVGLPQHISLGTQPATDTWHPHWP